MTNLENKLKEKEDEFTESTTKHLKQIKHMQDAMDHADETIFDMDKEITALKNKMKTYENKEKLNNESSDKPEQTFFKCDQCQMKVTTWKELNLHKTKIHGIRQKFTSTSSEAIGS